MEEAYEKLLKKEPTASISTYAWIHGERTKKEALQIVDDLKDATWKFKETNLEDDHWIELSKCRKKTTEKIIIFFET